MASVPGAGSGSAAPSPAPPSVTKRLRVVVGIALMISALVFAAVGLTLAIEEPESIHFVTGTFHPGFRRVAIAWTAVGFAFVLAGLALWLPSVRRCGKAMPKWTAVIGLLLAPLALVLPVVASILVVNVIGWDTHLERAKVLPATTTTLPPATCDASRGGCVVGVVQTTGSRGNFSIGWSELIALALGIGIVVVGWSWATRSRGVPFEGFGEEPP